MAKSAGIFVAALVLYVLTLTCAHYWDGVLFSFNIEQVAQARQSFASLLHPNHLLYSLLGFVAYTPLAGTSIRAITVMALSNCLCAAITVLFLQRQVLQFTRSQLLSCAACSLFALGATWWKFATDADAYIPAVLLVFFAVRSALNGRWVPAAMCHSAAMLIHEAAIFAAVPVIAGLYLFSPKKHSLIAYTSVCVILVSGVYLLAYRSAAPQPSFFRWITSLSNETKTTHTLSQILATYPLSYGKLLVGGKLTLIRDFFSLPMALALFLCIAFLVAAIFMSFRTGTSVLTPIPDGTKFVLWLWIVPYAAFLAWFEPGNAFYKLFLWPPAVLLLVIAASERPSWRTHAPSLVALAVAIGAWNYAAFIYPHMQPASDPVYALALRLNRELPPHATMYYRVFSPDDWYLAYFAPGRKWQPLPPDPRWPACLETTALDTTHLPPLRQHWALDDGKHNVRVACF